MWVCGVLLLSGRAVRQEQRRLLTPQERFGVWAVLVVTSTSRHIIMCSLTLDVRMAVGGPVSTIRRPVSLVAVHGHGHFHGSITPLRHTAL